MENSNGVGSRSAIDTSDKQMRRFQIYNGSQHHGSIPENNYYSTTEGEAPSMQTHSIIKKSRKKKLAVRAPNNGVKFEDSYESSHQRNDHALNSQPALVGGGANLHKYNSHAIDNYHSQATSPNHVNQIPEEMKRLKRHKKKSKPQSNHKLETIDSLMNDKSHVNRKNFDVHGQSELDHGTFNLNSSMDLDYQTDRMADVASGRRDNSEFTQRLGNKPKKLKQKR